jgi:hypothetical protein
VLECAIRAINISEMMEPSRLKNWVIQHRESPWAQWPYHIGARLIPWYFGIKSGASCWPRHSYVFSDIVPGLSDLDFTLLFEDTPPKRGFQSLSQHARWFKKGLMPILGEFNIYTFRDVMDFIPLANPFELRRDPYLIEKTGFVPSGGTLGEKIVFLLRGLQADKKNLFASTSALREKKWRRAFSIAGLPQFENFGLAVLVHEVAKLIREAMVGVPNRAPLDVDPVGNTLEDTILHYLEHDDALSTEVKMLFSNYFLWDVHEAIHVAHPLRDIVHAQLKWEAWGILSQVHQLAVLPPDEISWWSHHNEMCRKIDGKMNWNLSSRFERLDRIFKSE